jgi:ribonuclease VapC
VFVDTSAFVAILANEPDAPRVAAALESATQRRTSGVVRLETAMVLSSRLSVSPGKARLAFDRLIEEAGIDVVPLTDEMSRTAVEAFERYGKGRRNRAKLNLGDCLSYAAAKALKLPLLFIGRDFAATDIESVLAGPVPSRTR